MSLSTEHNRQLYYTTFLKHSADRMVAGLKTTYAIGYITTKVVSSNPDRGGNTRNNIV